MKYILMIIVIFSVLFTGCTNTESIDDSMLIQTLFSTADSESLKDKVKTVTSLSIVGNTASFTEINPPPMNPNGYLQGNKTISWENQYGNILTDLKYFTNLETLSIYFNSELDSIEFVSKMPKLRTLIIKMGKFTDLSPLESCTNLEILEITGVSGISDLTALSNLHSLETIKFSGCSIEDFSPLSEHENIKSLTITYNKTPINNLDNISDYNKLHTLKLIVPELKLSFLNSISSPIENLTLGGAKLNLSDLSNTSVSYLNIEEAEISDLTPFENCSNLHNLFIHNTVLPDNAEAFLNSIHIHANITYGLSHYDFFWLLEQ